MRYPEVQLQDFSVATSNALNSMERGLLSLGGKFRSCRERLPSPWHIAVQYVVADGPAALFAQRKTSNNIVSLVLAGLRFTHVKIQIRTSSEQPGIVVVEQEVNGSLFLCTIPLQSFTIGKFVFLQVDAQIHQSIACEEHAVSLLCAVVR